MNKIARSAACLSLAGAMALAPCNVFAAAKDETVYAKLQADGTTNYISVVERLVNDENEENLDDLSQLAGIENLNGFEGFVLNGEKMTWEAKGKDIYYSGTATQELPVKLEVSYKLDGTDMTADEMLGKSGKVEIRLKFTNLSKVGNLYTPFVAAVATTLPEDSVSEVEVTNGKATGNGRTVALAAVAAPGLYESLGLAELKGLDEVVLSYRTESFELRDIYTVVTPKLLDRDDLKTFEQLDELYASTAQLSESSKQLVVGTRSLRDGIAELKAGIMTMKAKLASQSGLLDEATITQIKQAAGAAAEKQAEAQSTTIQAAVKQQIETNEILMSALNLQATEICKAQYGACNETMVAGFQQKLVNGIEEQMYASSLEIAMTTARQTAENTAATVATQIAGTLEGGLGTLLLAPIEAMANGVDKLLAGADQLQAGMTKFDQEGIQTLANFVNGKVRVTSDRMQQLMRLAERYNNYAGIADGMTGETKFIYMIEGKKKK